MTVPPQILETAAATRSAHDCPTHWYSSGTVDSHLHDFAACLFPHCAHGLYSHTYVMYRKLGCWYPRRSCSRSDRPSRRWSRLPAARWRFSYMQ